MPFYHKLIPWTAHFLEASTLSSMYSLFNGPLSLAMTFSFNFSSLKGFQFEVSGIIGYITRWDVSRYLKKTFSYAVSRFGPHVVVMLGKLKENSTLSFWPSAN